VKVRWASAREHLPSYRELAGRNPHAGAARTFNREHCFRAPVRLLSARAPRQAVLRASFWLAPWLSKRPCDLPEDKTHDASDRLLPPERSACTRTSCVPSSLRDFHRVDTAFFRSPPFEGTGVLGSMRHYRGTECFTTLANASADRSWTRAAYCLEPSRSAFGAKRGDKSVGVFFPRRLLPIEPLTSLSPLPLPWEIGAPSRTLQLWLLRALSLSRVRKPPRSP